MHPAQVTGRKKKNYSQTCVISFETISHEIEGEPYGNQEESRRPEENQVEKLGNQSVVFEAGVLGKPAQQEYLKGKGRNKHSEIGGGLQSLFPIRESIQHMIVLNVERL